MLNKTALNRLEPFIDPLARRIYARGALITKKKVVVPYEELSLDVRESFEQLAVNTLFTLQLFEEQETIERIVHL
jgi:hypothetical protein